jgi:hypothetical protein
MFIILSILSIFGSCWILLGVMILLCGGHIKVEIINPASKKIDVITDIKIDRIKTS